MTSCTSHRKISLIGPTVVECHQSPWYHPGQLPSYQHRAPIPTSLHKMHTPKRSPLLALDCPCSDISMGCGKVLIMDPNCFFVAAEHTHTRTHDLITICAHTQAFHFPERGICSWQANPSSVEPHLPSAYTNMKERCWRLGSSHQRTRLSAFPPRPRQPRRRQPTSPVALIRICLRSQP